MEHEKNVAGGKGGVGGEEERRDGGGQRRDLEVNGGQLAAGRLRELRHHSGQGPILSLQPLLGLPQGLNLLYLGEVLQGGVEDREEEHRMGGDDKKSSKGGE